MKAVMQVIAVSQKRGSALPYGSIKEINVDTEMGITLYVWDSRRKIKLGLDRYSSKFDRIKQLLPHLRNKAKWRGFKTLDANNPNRIVVQL